MLTSEMERTEQFVPEEEKGVSAVQPPWNTTALKLAS